jgi:hypothetical protein
MDCILFYHLLAGRLTNVRTGTSQWVFYASTESDFQDCGDCGEDREEKVEAAEAHRAGVAPVPRGCYS